MMKKIFLLPLMLILVSTAVVNAQNNQSFEAKKDIIRLYPQYFIRTTFYGGYERVLSSRHSLEVDAGITSGTIGGDKYEGYTAELKFRIFFNSLMDFLDPNQQRGYMAPFINYQALRTTVTQPFGQEISDYSIYAGGMILGLQIFALSNLNFDLYIGAGVQYNTSKSGNIYEQTFNFLEPAYNGPYPKAGFSIGLGI